MTTQEILAELQGYGCEQTKKVLTKHGAKEPFFGVKVSDLKKIIKKTKKNHQLSLELYATGNSDAMYLAGLIADEKQITKAQLQEWADQAYWYYLSEFAVPWVAAESSYGWELGQEWILSSKENIAAAGWSTLASYAMIRQDAELDLDAYAKLLDTVAKEIHKADNRVRHTMNGFVISIACTITSLTDKAINVAEKIGKVEVFMGDTACKTPLATDYIKKNIAMGRIGKKKITARC